MIFWLDTSRKRPWVAEILGRDAKFGLKREFVPCLERRAGRAAYEFAEGALYQIQPTDGERYFAEVQGNGLVVISLEDAIARVDQMEGKKEAKAKELDASLEDALRRVRLNTEGGFSLN